MAWLFDKIDKKCYPIIKIKPFRLKNNDFLFTVIVKIKEHPLEILMEPEDPYFRKALASYLVENNKKSSNRK